MARGTVKWFSSQKGYGFIKQEEGGEDVFVHRSAVEGLQFGDELREGEEVEFSIEQTQKGLQATDVERVGDTLV